MKCVDVHVMIRFVAGIHAVDLNLVNYLVARVIFYIVALVLPVDQPGDGFFIKVDRAEVRFEQSRG